MNLYLLDKIKRIRNSETTLNLDLLTIKAQSIIGIAGHNGSGKSTLMRILAFLDLPDSGSLYFKGQEVTKETILWKLRRQVTLLTQETYLLKRSVSKNLEYGLKIRGTKLSSDAIYEAKCQALEAVGMNPDIYLKRSWQELSGGETQRVALATRLILKPEVLLLDEPTASLDEKSTKLICKAALNSRETDNTTIIIVSHDLNWLKEVSDSVIYLKQGKIQQ
ncbi:energy-coupling factor ABC transporter ATP-binding protein [Desulfovibrio litoralis]|uniref:Tungstate transport system ATP-binding protein n=1 Tax=Desulfovibrio litoralis DSM 11393 TaxID=1121455 RepID=A0A1M7S873_9BACT|nr:ABC transporter ATP-binding protein [Desulfovibrio litoralis]SHN54585.1 tungstate transport system ATP-binding protein [Desulfovibrio litoralis DSM 11393]